MHKSSQTQTQPQVLTNTTTTAVFLIMGNYVNTDKRKQTPHVILVAQMKPNYVSINTQNADPTAETSV